MLYNSSLEKQECDNQINNFNFYTKERKTQLDVHQSDQTIRKIKTKHVNVLSRRHDLSNKKM